MFKTPAGNGEDIIKRVIGLPGDTIQMRGGQLILNGVAVPKVRVADFVIPLTPNYNEEPKPNPLEEADCPRRRCRPANRSAACIRSIRKRCRAAPSYDVLDRGLRAGATIPTSSPCPPGHVFMMGDNRDD